MEVNEALVDKLANLARLKFNDAEKEAIKNDLQKMIQFVEKLNELDTTGVEPLLHMSSNVNVLRADEIKGSKHISVLLRPCRAIRVDLRS